jgi:hypothetical protein
MPQASLHFRLLEDYRSTTSPSLLPPFGARQREGMAASDSRRGGSLRLRSTCPAAPFGPTDSETKSVQVSEVPGNGCGRVKRELSRGRTHERTNASTHIQVHTRTQSTPALQYIFCNSLDTLVAYAADARRASGAVRGENVQKGGLHKILACVTLMCCVCLHVPR